MADETPTPRNRRERRAAAKDAGQHPRTAKAPETESAADIPLAYPDWSRPKGKTLYDLADERMAELQKQGQSFPKFQGAEEVEFPEDEEDFGPKGEALLWAFSLTMTHLMLDVLVHNQYREFIKWSEVWRRTAVVLPTLWFIVYLFHSQTARKFGHARQLVFLVIAIAGGCYCIYVGNNFGYFAVMKQAPPVGTLWIWSVVEMQKWYALVSVLAVGGYAAWNGYGLF